jgi:hypothetical protein
MKSGKRRSRENVATPHVELVQRVAEAKPSEPAPHKQVLERLKAVLAEINSWSMPSGEEGIAFLDCLDVTDQIREKARGRAKEMLLKEPGAIPGWTASQGGPVRELDKNTPRVFEALREADDEVTINEFLSICSVSLEAIRKFIAKFNPALSDVEVKRSWGEFWSLSSTTAKAQ